MNKKFYYQVHLEVVLNGTDFVFGFINISHIPYNKFENLFKGQITNEKFLFENVSYFIDKDLYEENKEFLDNEVPFTFDFDLFTYCVSLTGDVIENYVKDHYEELPFPLS